MEIDTRTPSVITSAPAITNPIDGCGWLLYTLSCLALGVDPRDENENNYIRLSDIIHCVFSIRHLCLGEDTRTDCADSYKVRFHGIWIQYTTERAQYACLEVGLQDKPPTMEISWRTNVKGSIISPYSVKGIDASVAAWFCNTHQSDIEVL